MGSKTEHPGHLGNQQIIPGAARISRRWDLRSSGMLRGADGLLQTFQKKKKKTIGPSYYLTLEDGKYSPSRNVNYSI